MTEPISIDQAFIMKLTGIVLANLHNENFGVNELARKAGISRATVHRKVKSILNQDVVHFIRDIRLKRAMEMIRNDEGTAAEIAFRVGFGSPAYFNKCFHECYGITPGDVRKKEPVPFEEEQTGNIAILLSKEQMPITNKNQTAERKYPASRSALIISAVIITGLLLIWFIYLLFLKSSNGIWETRLKDHAKSIVVLPLKNLSEDKETQYFAEGVMDDIINNLFRIKELRVLSGTTARQFRESTLSAPEIARKLNVNYVIEGSVQKYGSRVRIFIQLIDVRTDQHLLSEKYDREFNDIFKIESDISISIATKLKAVISPKEIEEIEKIPTKIPEAYNFYLQGRYFINQRKESGFRKSLEYFEKATDADTSYALAYAGIADAYFLLTWYTDIARPEGYIKSKEYALKALSIDKYLSEAHTVLGGVFTWGEWKWEDARKELLLAIELNPNFSVAHSYYSEFLDILKQNDEARHQINLAMELDPTFPMLHILSSMYYYHQDNLTKSLDEALKVLELDPFYSGGYLRCFHVFAKQGNRLKATEALQKWMLLDTLRTKYTGVVKNVYDKSGLNGVWSWLIELELKRSNPSLILIASWYASLGKKEEALTWLEKAFKERVPGLPRINNDPEFDEIRSEPRFLAIIIKMGLSDYH
jgi:TolB-like protein/AraC-like DNA-binding protein